MFDEHYELPSAAKKRKRNRIQWFIYGGGGIFMLVVGTIAFQAGKLNPQTGDDLCLIDSSPPQVWAFVVDLSDPINQVQMRSIQNVVNELKLEIDTYALFTVFRLTADPDEMLEPMLSLCNPGDGSNMSRIYQNPELAKKRWDEDFARTFDETLEGVLNQNEGQNSSPIMEGIQAVKVSLESKRSPENHLILFSDMLQHSDVFSHYRTPTATYEASSKSSLFRSVRTDLTGWRIQAYVLRRNGLNSSRALATYWDQYFMDMNGLLTIWDKLDG